MKNITMKCIKCDGFGLPNVLKVGEYPFPSIKANHIIIKVKATAINRADTLQRQGKYPNPPGSSEILGLEAAGYVVDENLNLGAKVIALLPGGGYAQYVSVHKDHIIPMPQGFSWEEAGGFAEVYLTAYLQIQLANLKAGDTCLVYAAASGVGIATLQLCHLRGIKAIAMCSSSKVPIIQKLNDNVIDRNLSYQEQINQIKNMVPQGVDAVLDPVGRSNVKLTIDSLKIDGRWILYGLMSGGNVDQFNLASLLAKRISLISTTLRTRSDQFKSQLVSDFMRDHNGDIQLLKPIIHKVARVQWDEDGEKQFQTLHEDMELNKNVGKLVVVFDD